MSPRIAVLIPCYNEQFSIKAVINSFQRYLPTGVIYVLDNNSTDLTPHLAQQAGAVVLKEFRKGKGYAVRKLFNSVDADVYVLVDGDNTYDVSNVNKMVESVLNKEFDVVLGERVHSDKSSYRFGHSVGNRIFTFLFNILFSQDLGDSLSGFRVMSRRFVKSFNSISREFEIEADLNIHAANLGCEVNRIKVNYQPRDNNSSSKLRTYRDSFFIGLHYLRIFFSNKPILFIFLATPFLILSLSLLIPIILFYIRFGLVPKIPSLIVSMTSLLIFLIFYVIISLYNKINYLYKSLLKQNFKLLE